MNRTGTLFIALAIAACAPDDRGEATFERPTTTTSPASTTVPPSRDPLPLEVTLADYEIGLATTVIAPGAYQLTVTNEDRAPHDVVLIQTEFAVEDLPTSGIRVDERDPRLDVRARTATIDPGGTGSLMATLRSGRYVLVCTVPHHYVRDGMAIAFEVPTTSKSR